jgi:hypothetical protein
MDALPVLTEGRNVELLVRIQKHMRRRLAANRIRRLAEAERDRIYARRAATKKHPEGAALKEFVA